MHPYLDNALLALALTAMLGLVFVNLAKDPVTGKVGVALFLGAMSLFVFVGLARLVLWLTGA